MSKLDWCNGQVLGVIPKTCENFLALFRPPYPSPGWYFSVFYHWLLSQICLEESIFKSLECCYHTKPFTSTVFQNVNKVCVTLCSPPPPPPWMSCFIWMVPFESFNELYRVSLGFRPFFCKELKWFVFNQFCSILQLVIINSNTSDDSFHWALNQTVVWTKL